MDRKSVLIAEFGSFTSQQLYFSNILDQHSIEFEVVDTGVLGEGGFELPIKQFYINPRDVAKATKLRTEASKIPSVKTYQPFMKKGFIWLFVAIISMTVICLFLTFFP